MHAHANDLRSEIENDWDTIVDTAKAPAADAAAYDAFVHQAVADWRECPLSLAMGVLLAYAEKVTQTPTVLRQTDIADLHSVGWSDSAIHDAVQVISYFNYINRVADATGIPRLNPPSSEICLVWVLS